MPFFLAPHTLLAKGEMSTEAIEDSLDTIQQLWKHASDFAEHFYLNLGNYIWVVLQIIFVILASQLLMATISAFTGRMIKRNQNLPKERQNPRVESMMTLLRSTARYVVLFGVIVIIMLLIGMEKSLATFLSAAGIGALAIGFGAQSLVKDVVSGLFISFENQFAVGDYVKIDEDEGFVEAMALRVTYIRSFVGNQVIIPNGTILRVVNYSRGGSLALVDIRTTYEANTRSVLELLDHTLMQWMEQNRDAIVEEPKVLGITAFEDSCVKLRVVCKAQPMMQWSVERSIRLAIKEAFDATGIRFAYPRMVYEQGSDGTPRRSPASHFPTEPVAPPPELRHKPLWQRTDINFEGGNTDDS